MLLSNPYIPLSLQTCRLKEFLSSSSTSKLLCGCVSSCIQWKVFAWAGIQTKHLVISVEIWDAVIRFAGYIRRSLKISCGQMAVTHPHCQAYGPNLLGAGWHGKSWWLQSRPQVLLLDGPFLQGNQLALEPWQLVQQPAADKNLHGRMWCHKKRKCSEQAYSLNHKQLPPPQVISQGNGASQSGLMMIHNTWFIRGVWLTVRSYSERAWKNSSVPRTQLHVINSLQHQASAQKVT